LEFGRGVNGTQHGGHSVARQAGSTESPVAAAATFARSGEYWTIGYGAAAFSLKDIKGLSHIQRLLQNPGQEFYAPNLLRTGEAPGERTDAEWAASVSDVGVSVVGFGDAGPMLDPQAKREYKQRLAELREELEELKQRGDHERAAKVEEDIDFLGHEIARAVGRGGRDRRAGSAAERARLNVTRAIKAALQKISEYNGPLGELLDKSIRTGLFCSYVPDPRIALTWQFSAEGSSAAVVTQAPPPALSSRPEMGFPRALASRAPPPERSTSATSS
jgi:uncharacterized membrane protein